MGSLCYIGASLQLVNKYPKIQYQEAAYKKIDLHHFQARDLLVIDSFFNKILDLAPEILVIDYTALPKSKNRRYGLLKLLRSHPSLSECKIIVRFENKEEARQERCFYLLGVNYTCLNGISLEEMFANIAFLFLGRKSLGLVHATAKSLNFPMKAFHKLSVKDITKNHVVVGCSFPMDPRATYLSVIEDSKITHFSGIKAIESKHISPASFYHYLIKIVHAESGDESQCTNASDIAGVDVITSKTNLSSRQDKLLIVEHTFSHFPSYSLNLVQSSVAFRMLSYNCEQLSMVKSYRPDLILINAMEEPLDDGDDGLADELSYERFEEMLDCLMGHIKDEKDYQPHIIILGHKQITSEKIRAKCQYQKMIVNSQKMSLKMVQDLIKAFQVKFSENDNDGTYYVPFYDSFGVDAAFEVNLVALSESIIHFSTSMDLPFYTVYEFRHPLPLSFMIIPFEKEPEASKDSDAKLYRALVLNIDEQDSMELRKIINILIKMPGPIKKKYMLQSSQVLAQLRDDYMEELLAIRRQEELDAIEKAKEEQRIQKEKELKAESEECDEGDEGDESNDSDEKNKSEKP